VTQTLATDDISRRLDRIIELLEDVFILQGSMAKMKRQELRRVVGLDMKRVNRISKHIKASMDDHDTNSRPRKAGKLE
jgi:ElaB/YqjD/DUF883 family membrane-anchored ribosome-binding protein